MMQRLPLVSTILVVLAAGIMVALGFWQLDRRDEKAAMKLRYEQAADNLDSVAWPAIDENGEVMLFRRSRLDCVSASDMSSMAGKNRDGRSGLAVTAQCQTESGEPVLVVLGWASAPDLPEWGGGEVTGIVAPGPRLIADPPLAGLEANAIPDPADIPDNHLAYAVQWFLFAATALVIYALAVRKRLAARGM